MRPALAGTQAGIIGMLTALGHPLRCIGIDVDAQPERVAASVKRIACAAAALLGVETRGIEEAVEIVAGDAGPSYGVPDTATLEAIGLAARFEALVLDPVYAGKSMAGLIGLVRSGRFSKEDIVIWLHNGGTPGLSPRWQERPNEPNGHFHRAYELAIVIKSRTSFSPGPNSSEV
jgi:1-aminocyclopropane-1-carboxylate deaminase/D-cysteine desulfhydrase-like pyridoxal-dependent ACC family enzyme